jgi:hypothetical protein
MTWRERLARRLVCPVLGHRWGRKMYGRLCRRCGIYEETHPPIQFPVTER